MTTQQAFLVTSATGAQGSAVAAHLLAAGQRVHALVRDPTKAQAIALQKNGAVLFQGDFADAQAIEAAASGCTGLFLNTWPTDDEARDAATVLNAARKAGVQNVVCSTVTAAEDWQTFHHLEGNVRMNTYWKGKSGVQEQVKQAGFTHWTIVQPAWLMTNFIQPTSAFYWPELGKGELLTALEPGRKVQLIDPADVGRLTAEILVEPRDPRWAFKILRLATEELTADEVAEAIRKVSGKEIALRHRSQKDIEDNIIANPMIWSQVWLSGGFGNVPLRDVEALGVQMTKFGDFLKQHREALLASLP